MLTFATLLFVGSASFISHLLMSHKHNLTSSISPEISWVLNLFDLAGVTLTVSRMIYLAISTETFFAIINYHRPLAHTTLFVLLLNLVSEQFDGFVYMFLHSIWHILIFIVMDEWLIYIKHFSKVE